MNLGTNRHLNWEERDINVVDSRKVVHTRKVDIAFDNIL